MEEKIKDYISHHLSGAICVYLVVLFVKMIDASLYFFMIPFGLTEFTNLLLYSFLIVFFVSWKFIQFVDYVLSLMIRHNIELGKKCFHHMNTHKTKHK